MATRYRADHVGSLLRPAALLEARQAWRDGRLDEASLHELEDSAIVEVLGRQHEIGLSILSDGELRRGSWITPMAEAVDGFVPESRSMDWQGPGGGTELSTSQIVGGELRPRRRIAEREAAFLAAHSVGPFKVTLPAASNFYVASWRTGVTESFYPSRAAMTAPLAAALGTEIAALAVEGAAYVQLDSPFYGSFLDDRERERLRADGVDPDEALDEVIAADNASLAGLDRTSLTVALHICRGNSKSRWLTEGGYEPIAERLFADLDVDRFLLEYDSDRAGGFEPLRFIPAGKMAVLGLVTTKEARLESVDDVRRRIDDAVRYCPLEQLALSPQCGFASVASGNLLGETEQWGKLQLVVHVAREVWNEI